MPGYNSCASSTWVARTSQLHLLKLCRSRPWSFSLSASQPGHTYRCASASYTPRKSTVANQVRFKKQNVALLLVSSASTGGTTGRTCLSEQHEKALTCLSACQHVHEGGLTSPSDPHEAGEHFGSEGPTNAQQQLQPRGASLHVYVRPVLGTLLQNPNKHLAFLLLCSLGVQQRLAVVLLCSLGVQQRRLLKRLASAVLMLDSSCFQGGSPPEITCAPILRGCSQLEKSIAQRHGMSSGRLKERRS